MGKHFDTLVELLKQKIQQEKVSKSLPDVRRYLTGLVERAALFEFPSTSLEIPSLVGKEGEEYVLYIDDYLEISEQHGHFLATPFDLTAIEDPESVVFLDNKQGNEYRVTICSNVQQQEHGSLDDVVVVIGDVKIHGVDSDFGFPMDVKPLYVAVWNNGKKVKGHLSVYGGIYLIGCGLVDSTLAYIQELVYIMDPENFIICRESRQGINLRKKQSERPGNKPRKLEKTVIRPHYICVSEPDMHSFLQGESTKPQGESTKPREFHAVRAYWKTFRSDRYVHKQGQRIFVQQYYRGEGRIEGRDGMIYQVMIKESPTTIVPHANK